MNTYLNNDNKGLLLVYVFSIQYFLLLLYNVVLLIKNTHCKTAHCVTVAAATSMWCLPCPLITSLSLALDLILCHFVHCGLGTLGYTIYISYFSVKSILFGRHLIVRAKENLFTISPPNESVMIWKVTGSPASSYFLHSLAPCSSCDD
jgi:hypothetical protein